MSRIALLLLLLAVGHPMSAQEAPEVSDRNDSVSVRLVDVDLRAAIHALGRYLDRPVVFGALQPIRVTLETPRPVPRSNILPLLQGLLESQDLELLEETTLYRIRAREPERVTTAVAGGGPIQLHVIRLRHARAADVAGTVNALYGRASALGEIGDTRRQTLGESLREHQVPPIVGVQPGAPGQPAARPAALTGDVTIVPDPGTNSLMIRASQSDFELIQMAVRELDVRPLQVLIEVLIAEVRRDRGFSFGLGVTLPEQAIRGTGVTVSGETTGLGLGDFVLKVMGVDGLQFEALLAASAARGDVSIVSRPVILAANNERASILVGSQRPFIQVSRSLPTDAATRDQIVQYRDVGTQLDVRPTISADGYVMLELSQEVNAATTELAFDAPVISTRSVQTRLLVRDGQTVVLGGLTDRQRDLSKAGVPILSSIPLIGGLFGRTSRRTVETELLLFITPRVIRNDDEADTLTEPYQKQADRFKR